MNYRNLAIVALGLLVVAQAAQVAQADPVGGTKFGSAVVQTHSTDRYTVACYGGEASRVTVDGDGDTDLDVYVYDQNGNLVASDTDYSDTCVVVWRPRWTGSFVIRVVNRGSVYNRYTIMID